MTPETLRERLRAFPRFPLLREPTPLHPLENLSRDLGVDLRVKRDDLTGLAAGGNKTRKLEFLLGRARAAGADTVLTAGWYHSNHALQTAAAAARAGLRCLLFLKAGNPRKGSLFLDPLCGAEVRLFDVTDSHVLGEEMDRAAEALRREGRNPYVIPVGGSDPVGALGYVAGALEIREQCDQAGWEPDLVVCPTSSGGTHAGLLAGIPPLFPRTRVLGVGVGDDPEEVLEAVGTLKDALGDLLDLPPRDEGFREAFCFDYGFGDYGALAGPVMDLIRDVASREGFFLDPVYTGKAFYGLRDRIRRGIIPSGSRVLFVHTGGLSGLFQYEEEVYRHFQG